MVRILFADKLAPTAVNAVATLGHEVVVEPGLGVDTLPDAVGDVDVLVVRSTRVTAQTISAGPRLGMILRAGAGTNTIDVDAASASGVYVSNVPGRNAVAVAELTMGLILAIDRNIPDAVADLRGGRWDKRRYGVARGLLGRSLGIVGLGDIGMAVAERAHGFGLVLRSLQRPGRSHDTIRGIEALGIELVVDLPALASCSDILTFHVPSTDETRNLVDAGLLEHVRRGAWIINTSRGDIVDETALLAALDDKDLRAGLDVYRDEPGSPEGTFASALAGHPRVYGTHHIGASTEQAQEAVAAGVVDILEAYGRGEILNCVNLETKPLGASTLTVRHHDRVGVLSEVLTVLKRSNLNVEQMENRIFSGARAACATIHVGGDVDQGLVEEIMALPHVIHVTTTTP